MCEPGEIGVRVAVQAPLVAAFCNLGWSKTEILGWREARILGCSRATHLKRSGDGDGGDARACCE